MLNLIFGTHGSGRPRLDGDPMTDTTDLIERAKAAEAAARRAGILATIAAINC